MMAWSLVQAMSFTKSLHDFVFPLGYGIALTGSVLMEGFSEKDLDLVIYPMKKISSDYKGLLENLPKFGLTFVRLPNKNLGYQDDGKDVQVWEYEGKRVDLFFLS